MYPPIVGIYVLPTWKLTDMASTPEGSWHADYRDTAYIYIGGLPFDLSEGDVITIFSQYGEPVHVNLVRDKETGKSRGFAFLKYEDQRSTDLAVDNLGGATVMGRVLRVDHTRYKPKEGEVIDDNTHGEADDDNKRDGKASVDDRKRSKRRGTDESGSEDESRPMLQEEKELLRLMREHDDEDPMKEYLITEKQEEVDAAIARYEKEKRRREKEKKRENREHREHRHHHRHHRDRRRSERES